MHYQGGSLSSGQEGDISDGCSGQEGDISDGSMDSRSSLERRSGSAELATKSLTGRFATAPQGLLRWGGPSQRHLNVRKAADSGGLMEAQGVRFGGVEEATEAWPAEGICWSNFALSGGEALTQGAPGQASLEQETGLSRGETVADAEPPAYPRVEEGRNLLGEGEALKYHHVKKESSQIEESPRSPLGQDHQLEGHFEKAVESADSTHSRADASYHPSPGGWVRSSQVTPGGERSPLDSASSGGESISRNWGRQVVGASCKAPAKRGLTHMPEDGAESGGQERGSEQLRRALAAAEASARRWKAAATAADSQARGFQVALAATEQTMQALNNRHVGEFAAAWERIREMEKRMTETVEAHAAQLAGMQAELAAKQKEVDGSQAFAAAVHRLEAENLALSAALESVKSERDQYATAGEESAVYGGRLKQLEEELAAARAKAARQEAERDADVRARLVEAEEMVEEAKQEARDALQQAEGWWQEILAKRDAKRVEELREKDLEVRRLLAVAEERAREVAVLQQEVSELQGGVSDVEWMKERMAGFEQDVIQEVSDLSRALEGKDDVIDGLQRALETARNALVEAEENLRREDRKHRERAAARAREFAEELSELEDLYRSELQKKEGQVRGVEVELAAAKYTLAVQVDKTERLRVELVEEREKNGARMAEVASEVDDLRARIVGAESAGKVAAALRAELEACRLECEALRDKYTCQQLEDVELGQQITAAQQQLEAERSQFAESEAELRTSLRAAEAAVREAQLRIQGLENEVGGVREALGVSEGPVELPIAVRALQEEADGLRSSLANALSQVDTLKGMEEQATAKSERMKELRKALLEAEEALVELQMKRDAERQGLSEQLEKALEEARTERDVRERAEAESATQIEDLLRCLQGTERALSESQGELRAEQALRKAAEERNAESGAEMLRVVASLESKMEEKAELAGQVSRLQGELQQQKRETQAKIESLEKRCAEAEAQLAEAEVRREEAQRKVAALEGQLREKSEGLSTLTESLEALERQAAENRSAMEMLEQLREKLVEVTSELQAARHQAERREGELRGALRERDESREAAARMAREATAERERGEKQSGQMKAHVQAAAEEYRRAKAAVKDELDRVNDILEQERVAASLALHDARQLQENAEERCAALESDLRTAQHSLDSRTADFAQLREQTALAEQETARWREQAAKAEAEVRSLQEEVRGYEKELRGVGEETERLRKGLKAKERVIAGLEEKSRGVTLELAAKEKQVATAGKDVERERKGRKELARKAEAATAAVEKSAQEKEEVEKGLAEVVKKLERAQKSKERAERDLVRSEKERQTLSTVSQEAEAALVLLRIELADAKSQLARCQSEALARVESLEAKETALEAQLRESERSRGAALEAQAVAQLERGEALGGLQEALRVVDVAVAQKEQAVRELEQARRDAAEAREMATVSTAAAEQAEEEKRATLQEKEAMIAAMEDVLAGIERERTHFFAMARAAAAELAHEMHKVKQLQASLQHPPSSEQRLLGPPLLEPWPKGFLVKQYLESDLAVRAEAADFTGQDWVPEKRFNTSSKVFGKPWYGGEIRVATVDQGTNTDSIVIDQGALISAGSSAAGESRKLAGAYGRTEDPMLNRATEQVEALRKQLAVTSQELESVRAAYQGRVDLLESELAVGRHALESVQVRNQELEAKVVTHANRIKTLTAEMAEARQLWASEGVERDTAHSAEVASLKGQLEAVHEALTSAAQELASERCRSESLAESAARWSLDVSSLSGRLRAWQEERMALLPQLSVRVLSGPSGAALGASTAGRLSEEVFRLSGHVRALTEAASSGDELTRLDAGQQPRPTASVKYSLFPERIVCGENNLGANTGALLEDSGQLEEERRAVAGRAPDSEFTSLRSELELQVNNVARLQKENRRLFRLVEQKEEELDELQKKVEGAAQAQAARPGVQPSTDLTTRSERVPSSSAEGEAAVIEHTSGESGLLQQLESARAELVWLRECLEECAQERQAAEEGLKRAFADELRTAAEKYESARAEFEERVKSVEAEAAARVKEAQAMLETEGEKWGAECAGLKERLREREKEVMAVGGQYWDAMRLAEEMHRAAAAAEGSRREMCAELERAVGRMREQQEVLEVLQQKLQAAEMLRASSRAAAQAGGAEERALEEKGEEGREEGKAGDGEGVERRLAALDGVIEMWRTACRQKDVEVATLRSALAATQALLANSEERLAHLRADFQRLDLANEDTCSELDRRVAEMAIAAKQLLTALQAANHPTAEIRTDAELADEGQLAQAAMAGAAAIGMEARGLARMEERVQILQRMQMTPGSAEPGRSLGDGEVRVRTPARKPAWLDPESVQGSLLVRKQEQVQLSWSVSKAHQEHEERALSTIRV